MHIDWQVQHAAPSETFLVLAELRIVNDVSTLERLGDPKLAVKNIEQKRRKQLGGLCLTKKLLPMALDNA